MKRANILIVDDEDNILELFKEILEEKFGTISIERNGSEVIKRIKEEKFDLILLDIRLPGINGIEILKKVVNGKKDDLDCCIIMITAFADVDTAVEAMNIGAYFYLQKPISDDELIIVVRKGLEWLNDKRENIRKTREIKILNKVLSEEYKKEIKRERDYTNIIGESKAIKEVEKKLKRLQDHITQF